MQIEAKKISWLLPVNIKEYKWYMIGNNRNWSCKFLDVISVLYQRLWQKYEKYDKSKKYVMVGFFLNERGLSGLN